MNVELACMQHIRTLLLGAALLLAGTIQVVSTSSEHADEPLQYLLHIDGDWDRIVHLAPGAASLGDLSTGMEVEVSGSTEALRPAASGMVERMSVSCPLCQTQLPVVYQSASLANTVYAST